MLKSNIVAGVFVMAIVSNVFAQPIVTDSTSRSTTDSTSNSTTTVKSPPPTAVAPAVTIINSDVCAVAMSGAAQTQILGISFGATVTDKNCERLKLARSVYDMGMKVAAVSVLCQDRRVYDAMEMAGTPCPFKGKLGDEAKEAWKKNVRFKPQPVERIDAADVTDNATKVGAGLIGLALLFLIK